MSVKLSYFIGEEEHTRYINPAGVFSLVLARENHRYKEEFSGEMIIKGDDFQWVMDAGRCTEIFVECVFKRTWYGVFTHTDCKLINTSKKYLEVTPRVDDAYRKFDPWMGLEMNIVPPFDGIESKVPVFSVNQYGIETRTVRITEPYTGTVAIGKTWEGYSVNDWIKLTGSGNYALDNGRNNSLISYLNDGIAPTPFTDSGGTAYFLTYFPYFAWYFGTWPGGPPTTYAINDQLNQLMWLDYSGFVRKQSNSTIENWYETLYAESGLFTLYEIRNVYKSNGEWEYCDIIYAREFYDRPGEPPSGLVSDDTELNFFTRGWFYLQDEKKWIRRPYQILDSDFPTPAPTLAEAQTQTGITGDGTWFTDLAISGQQFLKWNKNYANLYGNNWYVNLYGTAFYPKHFHKPTLIIEKFMAFLAAEITKSGYGFPVAEITSKFFNDNTNPYTGTANVWKNVLIGQNSDVKRPLASEQATKEIMTFESFLDTLCTLTNTAWAIIDREFILEHISYFEKGLSYGNALNPDNIINPFSIVNTAKNKGFMNLTNIYSYEKANMPKFEIFKTAGGSEPINDNVKIEYESACVNNLPKQNIRTINLDTTLDYDYTRTEGSDAGFAFVSTYMALVSTGGITSALVNVLLPAQDSFGRFVFNKDFTLADVVRIYHNWGRNDDSALLNGVAWPVTTFKNIIQNLEFRYKLDDELMENPYAIVATGIGYGIIKNLTYETKGHWLSYELGFSGFDNAEPPEVVADWHLHTQEIASDTWIINHSMNTNMILRPVAFDADGNEIGYGSLHMTSLNTITVTFATPVAGTMHFISMNLPSTKIFYADLTSATTGDLVDTTATGIEDVALGIIVDESGFEIRPQSVDLTYDGFVVLAEFTFATPVFARISMCNIAGGYMTNVYKSDFNSNSVDVAKSDSFIYGKPLVLQAGSEIYYNSHQLLTTLRRIGFSESVIATIIVMEKET
jgi:hypothetical protein